MKSRFYHILTLLAWLPFLWAGCSDEDSRRNEEEVPEGMEKVAINLFGLGLDKQPVQKTRAMENGTETESTVTKVYIHIYKADGTEITGLANPYTVEWYSYAPSLTGDAQDASGYVTLYLPAGTMATDCTVVVSAEEDSFGTMKVLSGSAYPAPPFYMSGICSSFTRDEYYTYTANVWLSRGVAKVRASFSVADDVVPQGTTIDLDNVTMQLLNVPSRIRPFAPYDSYKNPPVGSYPAYVQTIQNGWSDATGRVDLPERKAVDYAAGEIETRNGKGYYPFYAYENFVTDTYTGSVKLKVSIPLYQQVNATKIYLKTLEKTVSLRRDNDSTLLRNYIYPVDFIVKSGENVEVCTDMLEWENVTIPDILGTYLTASGIEMDKAGSIPCNFHTDGDTLFVDWTDMPTEVKRSGTQVPGMSSDYTYFTGLTAQAGNVPLEWTDAAKEDGVVKKSYMGFIRDLKLRVGNIERTVQISYIPTLVVDCHVIDMPLYAYVEGGSSLIDGSGGVSYYQWDDSKVLKKVSILSPSECSWLKLSTSRKYADGGMATTLVNTKAYVHCEDNPYYSADRYATIEYTLPNDQNAAGADHLYQLRIKQVIPIFVGYWGKRVNDEYTEALYTEQINEMEYGYAPYTLSYSTPVVYTDSYEGYDATFAGYRAKYYNVNYTKTGPGNNQADFYGALNYCASKNRDDGSGNIAANNQHWFTPAQFQLAGMLGLADRYDGQLAQPLNSLRTWHYSSTDNGRGDGNGAWGVNFMANRIGLINYGHYDDNLVRCVRTYGVKGKIEIRTVTETVTVMDSTGVSTTSTVTNMILDLTTLPGNYRSNTSLNLSNGATLGNERSAANTAYKKLRISRDYASSGAIMTRDVANGLPTMTWAIANGLRSFFNSRSASTATASYLINTGCNAYSEKSDGSDLGTWRLPTAREAAIMGVYAAKLGLADMDQCWTQTDAYGDPNKATFVQYQYSNNTMYLHNEVGYKTRNLRARCVREED